MFDIQVIRMRETIPLTQVKMAYTANGWVLRIVADGINLVDTVKVNGIEASGIHLLSDNELIVLCPAGVTDVNLSDVSVISRNNFKVDTQLLDFSVFPASLVTGSELLFQTFVKLLLQTPGTDILHPNLGGGLLKALRDAGSDSTTIIQNAIICVGNTVSQVMSLQSQQKGLSVNEKLLRAEVVEKSISADGTVSIGIEVTSQAGNTTSASVAL